MQVSSLDDDVVGGLAHPPAAGGKRPAAFDVSSCQPCKQPASGAEAATPSAAEAEYWRARAAAAEARAATAENRAESAEARLPDSYASLGAGASSAQLMNLINFLVQMVCSATGTVAGAPRLWTTKGYKRLERVVFTPAVIQLLTIFLFACATMAVRGNDVPPNKQAAEDACKRVRSHIKSGAATYGHPNALASLLDWTCGIVYYTNWPTKDTLVTKNNLGKIGINTGIVATTMALGCLSIYMKPERLSLTGAVIGATLLEIGGGVLLNAFTCDVMPAYAVKENDNVRDWLSIPRSGLPRSLSAGCVTGPARHPAADGSRLVSRRSPARARMHRTRPSTRHS
jgi:hypothetical protein